MKVQTLIQKYGANDQRTDAWHAKRGEMLTASEIYKATKDATPAARHELIMSKLTPRVRFEGAGPKALVWGTRFEPIAKEIYCSLQGGIEIVDTTCIPHPVHSFLGASPDGIIVTKDPEDFRYGKLVEFKCPISREFNDTTPIPPAYYAQMQLQMECTELYDCEYIEMGFKDLSYSEWCDTPAEYKSFFAVSDDETSVIYKDFRDPRDVITWKNEVLGENAEKYYMIFWILKKKRSTTVAKDPMWLLNNLESFKSVWEEIQIHRMAGTIPASPKEKATLVL